ncbi:MAG: DUF6457 domain-containing protein [Actinomycetaceae bacterium]|nr:DUF6457 domain-containing protein [Actinomycetaceae bacterium]
MSKKKDDPQTMAQMREWLEDASNVLGVDPKVVLAVAQPHLLDLAGDTARNTSRPGTPPTAFIVGLVAGLAGGDSDALIAKSVESVETLRAHIADNYKGGDE